jgi:hypothetical protein
MTLQTFLEVTADVPEAMLRPAMVAALAAEPARTPEAYRRFYDRVVRELSLEAIPDASPLTSCCSFRCREAS